MASNIFLFPHDIESEEQFMHFIISKKYKFKREDIRPGNKYAQIALPLPANLSTSYAATYSNQSLGIIGTNAGNKADENLKLLSGVINNPSLEGGIDSLKKVVANTLGMDKGSDFTDVARELAKYGAPELITAAAGGLGSKVAGPLGIALAAGVNQAVKGTLTGKGIVRNPHLAATFEGVGFKSHSFSFQLTPKSQKESSTLASIISVFRNAMLPSASLVKHYYDYPQQIDIEFNKSEYLFDIKSSVLTAFDVNYHGKGPFYHDIGGEKAPVEVTISMNFLETTVRLSDDEEFQKFSVPPPVNTGLGQVNFST
jgi:hypothetical protein